MTYKLRGVMYHLDNRFISESGCVYHDLSPSRQAGTRYLEAVGDISDLRTCHSRMATCAVNIPL